MRTAWTMIGIVGWVIVIFGAFIFALGFQLPENNLFRYIFFAIGVIWIAISLGIIVTKLDKIRQTEDKGSTEEEKEKS